MLHGGAVVLGDYGKLPRWFGRWDRPFWNGKGKTDNHAVYVERYDANTVVPRYVAYYERVLERPAFISPPLAPPEGLA